METENQRRAFLLKSGGLVLGTLLSGEIKGQSSKNLNAMNTDFFPGFKRISVKTSECTINGVIGGSGPPLLLLHGFPQSHIEWHKMAPLLSKEYTLVITDLRGYGDSSKPADGVNHMGYSKRSMARDQVELMRHLGFETFSVVGHDRGARVAHRMAVDFPNQVKKLVVMDIVPTHKLYTNVTKQFATMYFHWFFLIPDAPLPETLIQNNAAFALKDWAFKGIPKEVIPEDIFQEYLNHFSDPATLHAMCEDYRAGATIDLEHDEADLTTKVPCPVLVLWGSRGAMEPLFNVLETWKERASQVTGKSLPCGHWMAEELPEAVTAEVRQFLKG